MDFGAVEKNLGYVFKNKKLLQRALTLASYSNTFNNQTFEFLGDAILEFIVSEHIFDGSKTEGSLTRRRAGIVCDDALTIVSQKLELDKFLIKDKGDTNNQKAIPSVYEAVVAAVYFDGGMQSAKDFVISTLDFGYVDFNFKGELQEFLIKKNIVPEYKTENTGNVHEPRFETVLTVGNLTFNGVGSSKQQAEKAAAKSAYEHLKK